MLQVRLFGQVKIERPDAQQLRFRSQTELALLIYLAHTGQTHSREAIADLLWESRTTQQSLSNLRTVLTRLRRSAGDELVITRKTLAYDSAARLQVDSVQFRQTLGEIRQVDSAETAHMLQAALKQYQGDFLDGFYLPEAPRFNDWVAITREQLRQPLFAGYRNLLDFSIESGDTTLGIETAASWLVLDNLNETVHRQLMLLLAQSGRSKAALAQYEQCVATLANELGVAPQQATSELAEQIRAGVFDVPVTIVPVVQVVRHNLPREMGKFFGRITEVTILKNDLLTRSYPTITLNGVGGIGKTSLALAVGRALLDDSTHPYTDGIWFVALADVENSAQESIENSVATSIGQALSLSFHTQSSLWSQCLAQLTSKKVLLILDNVEQFATLAADMMMALVSAGEHINLLVTSRRSLPLPGSKAVAIGGLETPNKVSESQNNPSVQLFAERAAQLPNPFKLTDHLGMVVSICRFVEGLPLGIELAAAALGRLTIAEILPALTNNLQLIDVAQSNLPTRQRTLQAIFETSWQLLDEREQTTLAQISVFRGGFTSSGSNGHAH